MKFLITVCLAFLTLSSLALADTVTVSPQKTVIGKNVKIVIAVNLQKGETAYPPESVKTPEDVELKPSGDSSIKKNDDGTATQKFIVTLTPYTIGEIVIEPIKYSVSNATGQIEERVTNSITFIVESVRKEERDKPKDIRQSVDVKPRWRQFLLDIAMLLAAIVAGVLLWRWWSKREKVEAVQEVSVAPEKLPHEIAYERLETLKAQKQKGEVEKREFFFNVSEIVREYLENRFPILALERTTPELKTEFKNGFLADKIKSELFNLLELCDFVKFAKTEPKDEWAEKSIAQAVEFVDATRTRPTEEI